MSPLCRQDVQNLSGGISGGKEVEGDDAQHDPGHALLLRVKARHPEAEARYLLADLRFK